MIELNLLPDIKQEFVHAQRQKRLVVSVMVLTSIGAVALVLLLGFYAYAVQPVRNTIEDNLIADNSKKLKSNKNLVRNLTIQNQLSSITGLHEMKPLYQRLFDFLKVINPSAPNNISISEASILQNEEGRNILVLEASAKDFQAVKVFQDTLENAKLTYVLDGKKSEEKLFDLVDITEQALGTRSDGEKVASFKVGLEYNENTFAWNASKVSVKIPNKNTNQTAQNVFADAPTVTKEGSQ